MNLRTRVASAAARTVQRTGFEVTRDRFKHRFVHALGQHGVHTVLDVGANAGQFGQALRRAGFTGRIVSVEPLAEAHAALAARAARDPAWTVERAAVSEQAGSLVVNVSANSVSSSVLPILERSTAAAPQTGYVGTESVPATTVAELVQRHALDPAATLLKIDVQGYELPVLRGAGATLDRFAAVRTEMSLVPLYEGQALLPEMIDFFAQRGFELWYVEPGWVEPGTRRLLQLDGVFFR